MLWNSTAWVQIPAVPWASESTTLSLSFLFCKTEILIEPTDSIGPEESIFTERCLTPRSLAYHMAFRTGLLPRANWCQMPYLWCMD